MELQWLMLYDAGYDESMLQRAENELRHKLLHTTHWWKYWQNFSLSPTRTCYADASLGRDSSSLASSCKTWTEASNSTSKTLVRWRSILAIAQDCKGGDREQGSPSQPCVPMARVGSSGTRHETPTLCEGGQGARAAIHIIHRNNWRWCQLQCKQELAGDPNKHAGRKPHQSASAATLPAHQVLSLCHTCGEQAGHHQLPGHFARLYSVQIIRSLNGRTDMVQAMQRKHQLWCALKCTERTSLPIRHSYLQTQLWSNRMNQMDASTRWGTEVLPIARSLHSAAEQDGANRDLDRGTVPPCRRRNIQTWHVWKHTEMQEYTEITGTTMFKGREMLPSGELSAPFQPAVIHAMNTTREHAQARHCSRDLPPVGGKWRNRMQFNSHTQEKNPAEAALPELCQLHTWQWLSIQLEGKPCADFFSSSGAPRTWGPLCQPGMRWHETVRRVILAP